MDRSGTADFYSENAVTYARATRDIDCSDLYAKFLPLLPVGGHILDAGCGSGRDSSHFLKAGFKVTAFDACPELAQIASETLRRPVEVMEFMDLESQMEFDAVWCCASMLHVPMEDLPAVAERIIRALKPGGIWYLSFKYGDGERIASDGRQFWDFIPETLEAFLLRHEELSVVELWTNHNCQSDTSNHWVNAVVRRA
jgi:SAM-dependent methyltransferase